MNPSQFMSGLSDALVLPIAHLIQEYVSAPSRAQH
jgi:hypothetical protein